MQNDCTNNVCWRINLEFHIDDIVIKINPVKTKQKIGVNLIVTNWSFALK